MERSGQAGVRKESSGDPSMSNRRTSFSVDEVNHPKETAEMNQPIVARVEARKNSAVIAEAIPKTTVEISSKGDEKKLGITAGNEKKMEALKTAPKAEEKLVAGVKPTSSGHTNGASKTTGLSREAEKSTTSKHLSKPAPISTTKTTTSAKTSPNKLKSPPLKTPTTPKENYKKEAVKAAEKKPSRTSLTSQPAKPASRPTTTAVHGSAPKTRIQPSPPQTGFVKPRPKSPTRPVKLPASLTAHTASSGSKTATTTPPAAVRQSLSRASGNSQPINTIQARHALSRSPSRTSATGTATSAVTRKPSTLKMASSRPSLGPPPTALKMQNSRQSLPHPAVPADEGFLARMMRPTTSSSSKTAEKSPTSPPKRADSVKRPATRDGPPKHDLSKVNSVAHKSKEVVKTVAKEAKVAVNAATEKVVPTKSIEEKVLPNEVAQIEEKDIPKNPTVPVEAAVVESQTLAKAAEVDSPKPAEASKVDESGNNKEQSVEAPIVEPVVKETEDVSKEADISIPAKPAEVPVLEAPPTKEKSNVLEKAEVTKPSVEEPELAKESTPTPAPVLLEEPPTSEPIEALQEIAKTDIMKPELIEDPEDVKAREEIARLNAEVMKQAAEEEEL